MNYSCTCTVHKRQIKTYIDVIFYFCNNIYYKPFLFHIIPILNNSSLSKRIQIYRVLAVTAFVKVQNIYLIFCKFAMKN